MVVAYATLVWLPLILKELGHLGALLGPFQLPTNLPTYQYSTFHRLRMNTSDQLLFKIKITHEASASTYVEPVESCPFVVYVSPFCKKKKKSSSTSVFGFVRIEDK